MGALRGLKSSPPPSLHIQIAIQIVTYQGSDAVHDPVKAAKGPSSMTGVYLFSCLLTGQSELYLLSACNQGRH